jgi:rhomboid protease GluP
MFVHFDIMHLLANSFGIIVFGTRIERYFGRICFVILYVGTGLVGSLFSFANLYWTRSGAVSGGASGAVYGLIAAVFIITRVTHSYIETLNHRIMLMFIAIGLVMGFMMPGIDNAGHIGGMVGGVVLGFGVLVHMARKR